MIGVCVIAIINLILLITNLIIHVFFRDDFEDIKDQLSNIEIKQIELEIEIEKLKFEEERKCVK